MTTLEKIAKLIQEEPTEAHRHVKWRQHELTDWHLHASLEDLLDSIEQGMDLWVVPDTVTLKVELPRDLYSQVTESGVFSGGLAEAIRNAEVIENE